MLKTIEKEFKYNQRELTRNKIIFGDTLYKDDKYQKDGYKNFDKLTSAQLDELIKNRFVDPIDSHGRSPTVQEFLEFLHDRPEFTAYGYATSRKENNVGHYKIVINGVECDTSEMDDSEFVDTVCELFSHPISWAWHHFRGNKTPDNTRVYREKIWILWD